jgi:hypothetical protein
MAVVLDYGFEPGGGERELEQLLRGACADLAAEGYTHLGIASSAPSCAAPMLRGLADGIDEYLFQCAIPEPPAAAEHGIYAEVTDL